MTTDMEPNAKDADVVIHEAMNTVGMLSILLPAADANRYIRSLEIALS